MEVSEAIYKRRSVRKFEAKQVHREDLEQLINYARLAPSGMNKQPLEFVVVDDPKMERELFDYTSWAGAVDWTPAPDERPRAYIAILINPEVDPATEEHDAGLASANICLGAVEKGLGSCILGALEREPIKDMLDIPDHLKLDLVIGLGYPDQEIEVESESDRIDYWWDDDGVFHVPKKPVKKIMHLNGWNSPGGAQ